MAAKRDTASEPTRWQAILRARCPQCRLGPIFARWRFPGIGVLNESCPVCGTRYAREHGYYLGAMYISSAIVILAIPLFLVLFWGVTDWSWDGMLLASLAAVALIAPLVTSAARVLWLHFDRYFDPD
jgi:uncharacterized protein (DUF983 family)